VRLLIVMAVMCWLGLRANAYSASQALQPYPAVESNLDSISFVAQYAQKQYDNLRTDVDLFFTRYNETFTHDPTWHGQDPRFGPLPLLYDIKHRVQHHFTDLSLRMPSDMVWHLQLSNTCRRTIHMLQAYIEDVRERLQLSRYSPDSI